MTTSSVTHSATCNCWLHLLPGDLLLQLTEAGVKSLFQPPVSREQVAGTAQWCSLRLPIEGTSSIPAQAPIQH